MFFFNFSDCTFNKKLKSAMQATGFANYTKYIYWALVSESELLKKNSSKRLLFDFIFSKSEGPFRDFFSFIFEKQKITVTRIYCFLLRAFNFL